MLTHSDTVLDARRLSTRSQFLIEFCWDTTGFPTGGQPRPGTEGARAGSGTGLARLRYRSSQAQVQQG